ncbi:MAG: phytase [Saprospiraceae bacterium]|nr:phytase [Lewinella sp.]
MHHILSFWQLAHCPIAMFGLLFCTACSSGQQTDAKVNHPDLEAREDSLELIAAYERQEKIRPEVTADVETKAVFAGIKEDAADDPAIWVNHQQPSKSMIIGSNKRGGIATYDLDGQELGYYPVGNINNVDVAYGIRLADKTIDLVGGSNRSDQSIDLFWVDPENRYLNDISAQPFYMDSTLMDDVYGFCFYQSPKNGNTYALVNAKNGRFQQYLIRHAGNGLIDLQLVRDIKFDSQVEGMVADNYYGVLYIGEENRGVWKMDAEPDGSDEKHLISMSDESNPNIVFDVEGLTLYTQGEEGYLIVSSQGNFSYALFDRTGDNSYLFSFKIVDGENIDGVEETDGIQAISDSLSEKFPKGLFIAQDGFNYQGKNLAAQNFKLVHWERIAELLEQ